MSNKAALSEFGNDISGTNAQMVAQAPEMDIGARFFNTDKNAWYVWNGTSMQPAGSGFPAIVGLIALSGGGQPGATAITMDSVNRFDTVAVGGDSGLLPLTTAGLVGRKTVVINNTSNSMNVFPAVGDAINALGANTQIAVGANKSCIFWCTAAGQWNTLLSA